MSRLAKMDENMENMTKKKVLCLGIEPKLVDINLATTTGCQQGQGGGNRGK